ncbi:MAG: hypothetical protein M3P33_00250 [bacterium]|nr:hypothetical protein [bacterium]
MLRPGETTMRSEILTYYLFILVVSSSDLNRFAVLIQKQIENDDYLNINKLPINPFIYYFLVSFGKTLGVFAILLIGSLIYFVHIKFSIIAILMFTPWVLIAYFLAHLIFFILTSLVFYLESLSVWLFGIVVDFLSGRLIPIFLMPAILQAILLSLPFPYAFGALARNYSTFDLNSLISSTLIAIVWSIVLFFIADLLWHKGSYHYQENG